MAAPHAPLFHARSLREQMDRFAVPPNLAERHARILPWVSRLRSGALEQMAETKLHGDFLVGVFGDVLGYRGFTHTGGGDWEWTAEEVVSASGKSADGALGFFGPAGRSLVIAPIELKGAAQSLDHAIGRALTPVQQAWEYANFSPGCRWVIVSNYRETRLYSRSRTPGEYEVFLLDDLEKVEHFKRFYFLLARSQLLPRVAEERAPLDDLLLSSERAEAEITSALYADYRALRRSLYTHLGQRHSNKPAVVLLGHTQTILDRVLFVAFAEDRGLLPPNTLANAITHRDRYRPRPVWQNLVAVFGWINEGSEAERIPAYNGGLFRPDPEIDELEISDAMCRDLGRLAEYDYRDDVSVEVLGHIFEQSIADLEELRAEASGSQTPKLSKRKAEGVYYTPSYVTRFIVEETLGRALREKWETALQATRPEDEKRKAQRAKKEIASWERYRDALKETRVLDPACGSGAFLIAAFDLLAREYERVNSALAALRGGQVGLFDLNTTILNENLFGVDLNPESVEITKLSLWLKTCARGSKLTYLDRNIKCGNSIIADVVAHERAFDWTQGSLAASLFPPESAEDERIDARWREGFDVVIGNPPYVRQELLAPYKDYLQRTYRSYDGAADIFVYFFERGWSLLKPEGRLGFITSNSWLRSNFGMPLRSWMRSDATVETIVDLGDNRVFADAPDVTPAITIFRRGAPGEGARTRTAVFVRGEGIGEFVKKLAHKFTLTSLPEKADNGWQLGGDAARNLLDKLLAGGAPLGHGRSIYFGIKTGLRGAFVIPESLRDTLVASDPDCAGLLKRLVHGQNLRPWYHEDEGDWLIALPSGWTRKTFGPERSESVAWSRLAARHPELAEHLAPYAEPARQRQDQGDFWWELRPCAYYGEFARPKIFWPDIGVKLPRFSWDDEGIYLDNTAYFSPVDDMAVLGILQSRATWYVVSQICTPLGERKGLNRYRLFTQFTERLPIPDMEPLERRAIAAIALRISEAARARYALDRKTRGRLPDVLPAGKTPNRKLNEWWTLDFAAFRGELQKTYKADIPLRDRDDWQDLWKERRAEHARLTAAIVAGEKELNDRVYRLFELNSSEIHRIEEETRYPYGEV